MIVREGGPIDVHHVTLQPVSRRLGSGATDLHVGRSRH